MATTCCTATTTATTTNNDTADDTTTNNSLFTMEHLGLACEGEGVEQMLEDHPTYFECFSRLHHELLVGDGPLPLPLRRYIAIMAACRHESTYLVEEQKTAFLEVGGPREWLDGLQFAPKKLRELHYANIILAHRPWLFDQHHVQKLLKCGWSVSEATHAICLLAQFHALSSFVIGCGVEAVSGEGEVQQPLFVQPCPSGSPSSQELFEGGVDVLVERMKTLSVAHSDYSCVSEECTRESFEKLKKQAATFSSLDVDCPANMPSRYSHLSPDSDFVYTDFSKRGEKSSVPTLKSQDCSWEEHGFSLVSELYCSVADILDDKFKTAYDLTYYTCGLKTHIDTFPFRRGVWNYLHCLYGIRHDDYDYSQINHLLDRNLKLFLKTVSCFPERLACPSSPPDPALATVMKGFLMSEKIHVMVLVLEARLQAELLHGLRAIGHCRM